MIDMENKIDNTEKPQHDEKLPISGSTWDDLWLEFLEDCKNSKNNFIEASDFFYWLDYYFKVPERL